jgi:tetratricopeptide (TPR) repeat protein
LAGRPKEAEAAYRDALALYSKLAADFPADPEFRSKLAQCHANLGILVYETGRPKEAEAAFRAALALYSKLAPDFPASPEYQNDLAAMMGNVAEVCRDRKDFAEARRLLEGALPHHAAALAANPRHPDYRQFYRNNLAFLASILTVLGDHAAAVRRADELVSLNFGTAVDVYYAACVLSLCVPLAANDLTLHVFRRAELANDYAARAVRRLREAVAKGYSDIPHLLKVRDLTPLRRRADYAALLWDLAGTPPK